MADRESHGTMPLHRLDVPAPDVLPFAIGSFDSIGPLSRAPFPHRHTFHEIVHVTAGSGDHVLDLGRRPLNPPHLCVIAPGQVHSWERAEGLQGSVLLFDDAFLLAHPPDRELLRTLRASPWLRPTGAAAAEIASVVERMRHEYREQREGMISVLQAYLHILLVLASRQPDARAAPATEDERERSAGSAAVSQRFTRLVNRTGPVPERSVRALAAELGVSISYLNEAVKATTGRTPGQLLRDARVLEAKRLLAGTGQTVSRVAREVGFADPAYFCRFFRRETGTTPGEFRRAAGRNHHGHRTVSIDPYQPRP